MKIAPGSVLLGLATVGALGMAVKDTFAGPGRPEALEAATEVASGAEEELAYQREELARLATEREERETTLASHERLIPQLFGAEVASRGPLLQALELGMSVERFVVSDDDVNTALAASGGSLDYRGDVRVVQLVLTVRAEPEVMCSLVALHLDGWGTPTMGFDGDRRTWWNPTTGDRVLMDTEAGCKIVFDRALALDAWFARVKELGALKQRTDVARVVRAADVDFHDQTDSTEWWQMPALEDADDSTTVHVDFADARVSVVGVSLKGTPALLDRVIERMLQAYGKPDADDGFDIEWSRRHHIHVARGDSSLEITFSSGIAE